MDSILHQYLTKLRIVSKIPEHGKLDTTQNDLNIYYNTVMNWVWRKFNGDSKGCTTKYLVSLYREINSFSDQLMYNITTEQNNIVKNKKLTMLVSLTEKIKESLTGIRNLIGTYQSYLKVVSLLECLEQDIIIPQYHALKKFIPNEYQTDILKMEISYSHIHMSTGMVSSRNRTLSESNAHEMDMNSPVYTPPSRVNHINNIVGSPQLLSNHLHRVTQHSSVNQPSIHKHEPEKNEIEEQRLDCIEPTVHSLPIDIPKKKGNHGKKKINSLY